MEMMDIVDNTDTVIAVRPQSDVYQEDLMHRIVHILLYNKKGEMALQLRSPKKSFCPLHWSPAAGGHVQAGESYEVAAQREMKEEIGIDIPLRRVDTSVVYVTPNKPNFKKFLGIFAGEYDGPFTLSPEEVEDVQFFSQDAIDKMVADGEKIHPELLFLFEHGYHRK